MIAQRSRRRTAALGTLGVASSLLMTAAPQPASADGTRTFVASTTCDSGVVPYGFNVDVGAGWNVGTSGGSSAQTPGTQTKVLTITIPSTATSVALDSFCYIGFDEANGRITFPYGTWIGWTYSLSPGTSTANSTWVCSRHTVYPGPWIRTCALTSISYG
jgi:hypothetical protein